MEIPPRSPPHTIGGIFARNGSDFRQKTSGAPTDPAGASKIRGTVAMATLNGTGFDGLAHRTPSFG